MHLFVHSFIPAFIHSFSRSSFIHSFIHSIRWSYRFRWLPSWCSSPPRFQSKRSFWRRPDFSWRGRQRPSCFFASRPKINGNGQDREFRKKPDRSRLNHSRSSLYFGRLKIQLFTHRSTNKERELGRFTAGFSTVSFLIVFHGLTSSDSAQRLVFGPFHGLLSLSMLQSKKVPSTDQTWT